MQLRTKLGALALAASTAAFLLAGAPALASSNAPKGVTGPEVIAGTVHGKMALANRTEIPLTWQGVVGTNSTIVLGGGGGPHKGSEKTLSSPAGNLTVMITQAPQTRQTFDKMTCRFAQTVDLSLTVVGGKSTGRFAGASGPGAVRVHFAAYAPRYTSGPHKGQCDTSNNAKPLTKGAVASFLAGVVMTIQ